MLNRTIVMTFRGVMSDYFCPSSFGKKVMGVEKKMTKKVCPEKSWSVKRQPTHSPQILRITESDDHHHSPTPTLPMNILFC